MSVRKCLDCGEVLKGRSDKKFCSDQCRNNYNNTLNRETNHLLRNIHAVLRKNRRILAELFEGGKRKLHKDALLVSEFNLSFFTHMVESEDGKKLTRYCYEYGIIESDDDYVELVKNVKLIEL